MIFFSKNDIDEWIFRNRDGTSASLSAGRRVMSDELKEENISERDPNQIEIELKEDASTNSAQEIVIEFPLKSRRRK